MWYDHAYVRPVNHIGGEFLCINLTHLRAKNEVVYLIFASMVPFNLVLTTLLPRFLPLGTF